MYAAETERGLQSLDFLLPSPQVCCAVLCVLSHVWLFATPWTRAHQAPLSMEFSRQEYWSGLPFPTPGKSSWPRGQTLSLASPALAGRFFTTVPLGKPLQKIICWPLLDPRHLHVPHYLLNHKTLLVSPVVKQILERFWSWKYWFHILVTKR